MCITSKIYFTLREERKTKENKTSLTEGLDGKGGKKIYFFMFCFIIIIIIIITLSLLLLFAVLYYIEQ